MKDESSLIPGGVEGLSREACGIDVGGKPWVTCGGGGGGKNGEFGLEDGMVEAMETDFFCACIRPLYTVFNSSTSLRRRLFQN